VRVGAAYSYGLGAADKFADADIVLAGEKTVRRRSLKGREQMAEQGFATIQSRSEYAKTGASLVDGDDSTGAVQIVEGVPLGLEVGDGRRGS
jgi:hypothetical protein